MQQLKPHTSHLRAVLVLLITNSACVSVQWRDGDGKLRSVGFIHYSVIDTGRARVFVHRTAGLNVRLTSFDGGVTLGYRKYVAIQPCNATVALSNSSGSRGLPTFLPMKRAYIYVNLGAEVSTDSYKRTAVGLLNRQLFSGQKQYSNLKDRI
jgi:hypothetical protein